MPEQTTDFWECAIDSANDSVTPPETWVESITLHAERTKRVEVYYRQGGQKYHRIASSGISCATVDGEPLLQIRAVNATWSPATLATAMWAASIVHRNEAGTTTGHVRVKLMGDDASPLWSHGCQLPRHVTEVADATLATDDSHDITAELRFTCATLRHSVRDLSNALIANARDRGQQETAQQKAALGTISAMTDMADTAIKYIRMGAEDRVSGSVAEASANARASEAPKRFSETEAGMAFFAALAAGLPAAMGAATSVLNAGATALAKRVERWGDSQSPITQDQSTSE